MIPFPGESLAIFGASVTLDTATTRVEDRVTYRTSYLEGIAADVAAEPGAVFRAWVKPGSADYLEAATPVEVSWVVEIVGALSVTASEGFDPDWSESPDAPAGTPLGTHASDASTLVIPSTFTVEDVMGASHALMLRLDVLPGSDAVVTQVKLRVWPAGGVSGGWVHHGGFDAAPVVATPWYAVDAEVRSVVTTDPAKMAWDLGYGGLRAVVLSKGADAETRSFYPLDAVGSHWAATMLARVGISPDLFTFDGQVVATMVLLPGVDWVDKFPIDPSLTEGVDWVRPPDEVVGDFREYAQQLDEGSTGWINAKIRLAQDGDCPGIPTIWSTAGEIPFTFDLGGLGAIVATLPIPVGNPLLPGIWATLATTGRVIYAVGNYGLQNRPWPGVTPGAATPYVTRTDMRWEVAADARSFAKLPPYLAWSPTRRRPLRQFHRDDGQGVTPPRAFGGASRIRTGRAYGYD